jgi:hypothetical protein
MNRLFSALLCIYISGLAGCSSGTSNNDGPTPADSKGSAVDQLLDAPPADGTQTDSAPPDRGAADAAADLAVPDSAPPDSAVPDSALPDSAAPDATIIDLTPTADLAASDSSPTVDLAASDTGATNPCGAGFKLVGQFATWCGKVNVHTVSGGSWKVDSDCKSGCNLKTVTYCKKFWSTATKVVSVPVDTTLKPFATAGCKTTYMHRGGNQYACCAP